METPNREVHILFGCADARDLNFAYRKRLQANLSLAA
jgi:hypothetical protein